MRKRTVLAIVGIAFLLASSIWLCFAMTELEMTVSALGVVFSLVVLTIALYRK